MSSKQKYFTKYINLMSDFGFKRIFGDEQNTEFLIDFLRHILPHPDIESLEFLPTIQEREQASDRVAVFDLYCRLPNGERIMVEIQRIEQEYYIDRSIFYSSFSIKDQGKRGGWDYSLCPVYSISILNFLLDKNDKRVIKRVKLLDISTRQLFYDKLEYIYVQLPNLHQNVEMLNITELWLYLIKNLHNLDETPIPSTLQSKEVFMKLLTRAELAELTDVEQISYEKAIRYKHDIFLQQKFMKEEATKKGLEKGLKKGLEKGLEQGREQGLEKGLKKGREQGREQGERTNKISIAQKMLKMGLSIQIISEATGLGIDDITSIQQRDNEES